ncbi:MAG: LysM peptidoglycan-binding domain-containing protein [Pirellulaceae bacterium]|nr:LysM peptidoglycan-binding domain-containing protein [Pirellulaceae bacterium]
MQMLKNISTTFILAFVLYGAYLAIYYPEMITGTSPSDDETEVLVEEGDLAKGNELYRELSGQSNNIGSGLTGVGPSAPSLSQNPDFFSGTGQFTQESDNAYQENGGQQAHLADFQTQNSQSSLQNIQQASSSNGMLTSEGAAENSRRQLEALFEEAWKNAEQEIQENRYAEALRRLTIFYQNPDLSSEQTTRLITRLDQLAGSVIYSTEHRLEEPYQVVAGETLDQVADKYGISEKLLGSINGLSEGPIPQGTVLKVFRGQFYAEVDLDLTNQNGLVTVFLGPMYAGRFAVQFAGNPPPEGVWSIAVRQPGYQYLTATGQALPARHPENPFGQWYLATTNGPVLHAMPTRPEVPLPGGTLAFTPLDASDIYGILTLGSQVRIRHLSR